MLWLPRCKRTIVASALAVCSARAGVALDISIGDRGVTVSQATSGGAVVLMSVARIPSEYRSIMARRNRIVRDSDNDGTVTFSLDEPAAVRSVFVAVDLTTGALATAKPAGSPFAAVELGGLAPQTVAPGLASLREPRSMVEALFVRPGLGAWGVTAGDGAQGDADGSRDNTVSTDLASMVPIEGIVQAPATLLAGDILVVVDPKRMEYYAGRVAP